MVLAPKVEVMTESPVVMVERRVSVDMGMAPPTPPAASELPEPVTVGSRVERMVVEPTVVVTSPSLPEMVETIGEVVTATPSVPVD